MPDSNLLSFCFAKKKVGKEKGDPGSGVSSLREETLPVLGKNGVKNNSALRASNKFLP